MKMQQCDRCFNHFCQTRMKNWTYSWSVRSLPDFWLSSFNLYFYQRYANENNLQISWVKTHFTNRTILFGNLSDCSFYHGRISSSYGCSKNFFQNTAMVTVLPDRDFRKTSNFSKKSPIFPIFKHFWQTW